MIEIEIELRDTSVRLRYTSVEGSLPLSSLIFTADNDQFTVLAVFHSAMLAQRLFFPRPAPSRFREIPDFVTRTRPCSLPLSLELVVHDRAEESADRACTAPFVSEAWIEPREFGLALEKSVETPNSLPKLRSTFIDCFLRGWRFPGTSRGEITKSSLSSKF